MPLGQRLPWTIDVRGGPQYAPLVRAYALVELGDAEAIDLFLQEEDARRALEGILSDEPDWGGQFYVQSVGLEERDTTTN